ncbi:hypothetical protein [Streptomyces cyaneochromogenes]|uniref:hypothetical protein n=1 Tax=Streptomyces cyaneochromogenes TaxID=2496836 RepID=UPI001588FDB4|nr:hypothetical protein [Streptomyces cyaneochromogenes]
MQHELGLMGAFCEMAWSQGEDITAMAEKVRPEGGGGDYGSAGGGYDQLGFGTLMYAK